MGNFPFQGRLNASLIEVFLTETEKDFCCIEFLNGFEPIINSSMQQDSLI